MTSPIYNLHVPLCSASGIYDDLELYNDQLIIRPRAFFAQIMAYAEILDVNDVESITNYVKRSDHSSWIQMKIKCHNHKPIEVAYRPSERPKMRELNNRLIELVHYQQAHA